MNQNDKRSQVCGLSFLPTNDVTVINIPGKRDIQVSGTWIDIGLSSGEWKETIEYLGQPVAQELKATVTNTSKEYESMLRNLFTTPGLLLLKFSNTDQIVVGTDEFPVSVTVERSGDPSKIYLSCKRDSPEPAKYL